MNAQTQTRPQTFTLATGTTNRHQWHKKAQKALYTLNNMKTEQIEKYGIKGGDERESLVSVMFGPVINPTAETLYNQIGDDFGWMITKDNADAIEAAALAAHPIARAATPIEDNRTTPEERAEQVAERNEAAEQYAIKQADKNAKTAALVDELRIKYPWAIADDGKMSRYARAAKNMKIELQQAFPHVKFSVRSESFSMGNAVRVSWDNGPCTKTVDEITDKYQYYVDKYTNDNSATASAVSVVLGQSKYVSTSRDVSPELREQVGRDICKEFGEEYDTNARIGNQWLSDCVHQALHVDIAGEYAGVELGNTGYVAKFEAVAAEVKPAPVGDFTIEEHTHTKKGFQMFIAIPAARVERAEYLDMLAAAKALGGWYSRKWGTTPGGFAFKSLESAQQFVGSSDTTPPTTPKPTPPKGDKFRAMADKMQPAIDDKMRDRETNTAKRLAQANRSRLEGERLQRTQAALYAMASLCDSDAFPAVLGGVNSKKAVYDLLGTKKTAVSNGYHGYSACTGEPADTSPQAVALWSLLSGKTDEEKQADELRRKIEGLQFSNIPGYFPTPQPVIDLMLDHAQIDDRHAVLEPSAGSGAIADAVKPICDTLQCFETNHTLSEILTAKGHRTSNSDFMAANVFGYFDRVLMNPPFENQQDIDHVRHAFKFLKEGGRLVSVMGAGAFYNSNKKATEFRAWADNLGAEYFPLPDNSFKASGTGVATYLIIINKEA